MISALKQLLENADAIQEKIVQVQKEGERDRILGSWINWELWTERRKFVLLMTLRRKMHFFSLFLHINMNETEKKTPLLVQKSTIGGHFVVGASLSYRLKWIMLKRELTVQKRAVGKCNLHYY